MFSDRAAPFFDFATQVDLPPFGDDFVEYLLNALASATKRRLDRAPAVEAFDIQGLRAT